MSTLSAEGRSKVEDVLRRAAEDISFREQLLTEPAVALKGVDLTSDEKDLLISMRRTALEEWGVDVRRFRTFLMDNGNTL